MEEEIAPLVAGLDEAGRVTLDLAEMLRDAQEDYLARREAGRPDEEWDETRITGERWAQILRNPAAHIEFIYQNRRFKLKPIGTMEPVPKRVREGPNGSLYYYKTRSPNEERLPRAQWTKIYLKPYQVRQCLMGQSDRSEGLAGFVGGVCANQPANPRQHAAREPRKTSRQRREWAEEESSEEESD